MKTSTSRGGRVDTLALPDLQSETWVQSQRQVSLGTGYPPETAVAQIISGIGTGARETDAMEIYRLKEEGVH